MSGALQHIDHIHVDWTRYCVQSNESWMLLSDPSPIIGPLSLTDSLRHSCSVDLIDVTLTCEDADSKLFEVITVDDEDRVGTVCCRFES